MKKICAMLLLLLLGASSSAFAVEPTKENLTGKWNLSFKGTMISNTGEEASDINAALSVNMDTVEQDTSSLLILRDSTSSGDYMVFFVTKNAGTGKSNGTFNMSLSYTSGSSTLSAEGTLFLKTGASTGMGTFSGVSEQGGTTAALFSGTLSLARY